MDEAGEEEVAAQGEEVVVATRARKDRRCGDGSREGCSDGGRRFRLALVKKRLLRGLEGDDKGRRVHGGIRYGVDRRWIE